MDKIWIVFLFLGVLLVANRAVKILIVKAANSGERQGGAFVSSQEKEDPAVFWENEGLRREPEQAEIELSDEDFFENEKTEFSGSFEEEFKGISDLQAKEILIEAGIYKKEGEL